MAQSTIRVQSESKSNHTQVILGENSNHQLPRQKDATQNSYVGFDCNQFAYQNRYNKFTHNLQKKTYGNGSATAAHICILYQHELEFLRNRITKWLELVCVVFSQEICLNCFQRVSCTFLQLREYQNDLEYRLHHRLSKFDRSVATSPLIQNFGLCFSFLFIQKLLELVR